MRSSANERIRYLVTGALAAISPLLLTARCEAQDYGSKGKGPANPTSLIALIAQPTQFDGKEVATIGVFYVSTGIGLLCVSTEDVKYGVATNCIQLDLDLPALGVSEAKLAELNGRYVVIQGVFRAEPRGAVGQNPGVISPAWRVARWGEK
jgi:hypothetical protein